MGKTQRNNPQGSKNPDGSGATGRNNTRRRPSGPVPREVQVSKKLSFLLRHGAEKQGLKLGVGGYINVADVLSSQMIKSAHVTFEELKEVVANNEKKRYGLAYIGKKPLQNESTASGEAIAPDGQDGIPAINQASAATTTEEAVANEDADPAHYLIRANQGHSIKLEDTAGLLTPITLEAGNLPAVVVHGTRHQVWPDILESGGLKPMTRQHVHFATGVPEKLRPKDDAAPQASADGVAALSLEEPDSPSVVSGMRVTSTVLMFLDLRKALQRGLTFSLSENGVVLTQGNDNGVVSLDYFSRVETKDGQVLVQDGKVISELKGYAQGKSKHRKTSSKPKLNTKDKGADDDDAEESDA